MNDKQLELIQTICKTYETLAKELKESIETITNSKNSNIALWNNDELVLVEKGTKQIVAKGDKTVILDFLHETKQISIGSEFTAKEISRAILNTDYILIY